MTRKITMAQHVVGGRKDSAHRGYGNLDENQLTEESTFYQNNMLGNDIAQRYGPRKQNCVDKTNLSLQRYELSGKLSQT